MNAFPADLPPCCCALVSGAAGTMPSLGTPPPPPSPQPRREAIPERPVMSHVVIFRRKEKPFRRDAADALPSRMAVNYRHQEDSGGFTCYRGGGAGAMIRGC